MRADLVCPHCHQPMRYVRAGVHLGPTKTRIFDLLRAAGDVGVSSEELIFALADDGAGPKNRNTIKAHIYQTNELLAGTDYGIVSDRARPRRWQLARRRG